MATIISSGSPYATEQLHVLSVWL